MFFSPIFLPKNQSQHSWAPIKSPLFGVDSFPPPPSPLSQHGRISDCLGSQLSRKTSTSGSHLLAFHFYPLPPIFLQNARCKLDHGQIWLHVLIEQLALAPPTFFPFFWVFPGTGVFFSFPEWSGFSQTTRSKRRFSPFQPPLCPIFIFIGLPRFDFKLSSASPP